MQQIQVLVLLFKNKIEQYQVPLLRGAIINRSDVNNDILLHNHIGDEFRYSYPMVQYKRIDGKAAIVCINEGCNEIANTIDTDNLTLRIGHKVMKMEAEQMKTGVFDLRCTDEMNKYQIHNWLPLNNKNYIDFKHIDNLAEKCQLLEKIMTGNILSLMKSFGIFADKNIICSIQDILETKQIESKGVKMLSFDIAFKTNVVLPEFIGLGKHTSLGYGTIYNG